jgi:hypothetical protein
MGQFGSDIARTWIMHRICILFEVCHLASHCELWRNMRTTTAKNMRIIKYHQTSLISYERGWPLACLEDLIKPTNNEQPPAHFFTANNLNFSLPKHCKSRALHFLISFMETFPRYSNVANNVTAANSIE